MSELRRRILFSAATIAMPFLTRAQAIGERGEEIDRWMNGWMQNKTLVGRLVLSRFVEPVFFLVRPISWKPGDNNAGVAPVHVPTGFVTDLASIPRVFWSALRPDGEYAYAAIIHDYLYWMQSTSREDADLVFKFAMEDLKVSGTTVSVVYEAVRRFGADAWSENARIRQKGERRILKRFPDDPTTRWEDWKKQADVFS